MSEVNKFKKSIKEVKSRPTAEGTPVTEVEKVTDGENHSKDNMIPISDNNINPDSEMTDQIDSDIDNSKDNIQAISNDDSKDNIQTITKANKSALAEVLDDIPDGQDTKKVISFTLSPVIIEAIGDISKEKRISKSKLVENILSKVLLEKK
jgi:hypothetical protein